MCRLGWSTCIVKREVWRQCCSDVNSACKHSYLFQSQQQLQHISDKHALSITPSAQRLHLLFVLYWGHQDRPVDSACVAVIQTIVAGVTSTPLCLSAPASSSQLFTAWTWARVVHSYLRSFLSARTASFHRDAFDDLKYHVWWWIAVSSRGLGRGRRKCCYQLATGSRRIQNDLMICLYACWERLLNSKIMRKRAKGWGRMLRRALGRKSGGSE